MKGKSKRASAKHNAAPQNATHTEAEKAELKTSGPSPSTLPNEEMLLQFGENEVSIAAISDKVKQNYKNSGNTAELKDIKIYIKPEDNKAYYVVNGDIEGSVDLTSN
ncbi:hypothetical protein C823_003775 [Eubacterium plexicaudatum ASF492]|uniref:Uncharacterized protein n=1 Tax=Eubacterium plexicaudatum ASF492 TaxID=1235802 RepID=N1ZVE9_9FIRM|nr:hypothetical protein C823_003775 [Eubacterium plexicaudatum ASF492]